MNLLNRLKEQKESGESMTILILLCVLFIAISAYESFFTNMNFNQYVGFIGRLLALVVFAFSAILLEKKGASLVAHLLFFIVFVDGYIRAAYTFILGGFRLDFFDLIITIVGVLASIYALLKVYVHRDEVNKYVKKVPDQMKYLLIVLLVFLYMNNGFAVTIMYTVVLLLVVTTTDAKSTMLIALPLFFQRVITSLVIISRQGFFSSEFAVITEEVLSLLIYASLTFFSYVLYKQSNYDDNQEESYVS